MIGMVNEFLSEYWAVVYGLLMYGLGIITGYITGYFDGKRSRRKD